MKINTYSKISVERNFKEGVDNSENALISILSSADTPLSKEVKDSYGYVLELRFDDVPFNVLKEESQDKNSDFYGMKSFNVSDYIEVCKFIFWTLKGTDSDFQGDIHIHCTAGISRSGAVAIGVSLLLQDEQLYEQVLRDNIIRPNQLVLAYFIQDATKKETHFFDVWSMCDKLKNGGKN